MSTPLHLCYLALGSNLGDTLGQLALMREQIAEQIGRICAVSRPLTTQPVGFFSDHLFSNQVIAVETMLSPRSVIEISKGIERALGRQTKSDTHGYTDRVADIDLILYGDQLICEEGIEVPHPRFRERDFVLRPLVEIAPELRDPVTGMTMRALLDRLEEQGV